MNRTMAAATVATVVLFLLGILLFVQTKDPFVLMPAVFLSVALWIIVLIVHVLRHGIPVRLVDERRP